MTAKTSNEPTLGDVILSINGIKIQIDSMQSQMDGVQTKMDSMQTRMDDTNKQISSIQSNMVTKDEFNKTIDRLKDTIKTEASDLGDSIHSLSNMVSDKFSSLRIISTGPRRIT